MESFLASVIKDKPANIDRFFDSYVGALFSSSANLASFIKTTVSELSDHTNEGLHPEAYTTRINSLFLPFTEDFLTFARSKTSKSEVIEEQTVDELSSSNIL